MVKKLFSKKKLTFCINFDIIHSMIRKSTNDNKFFYIQCGDWDATTIARSHREACKNAISQAIDYFNEETQLTELVIASECEKEINNKEDSVEAFLVESILEEMNEY